MRVRGQRIDGSDQLSFTLNITETTMPPSGTCGEGLNASDSTDSFIMRYPCCFNNINNDSDNI